jgi:predicted benzoate:H+ symporter BenE
MMSHVTDGYLLPRNMARPVGLIAGIAALELLTFVLADFSTAGGLSAAVPWMVLDFFLLRKIWRGSSTAWTVLVVLDIGVIVLCALTLFEHNLHVDGGPLVVVRLVLEIALLVAPGMRRWVAQG